MYEKAETLQCVLLGCILSTARHTSNNIAHELGDIINEWDLNGKVVAIVTDNAANIIGAVVDKLKKKHIGCFAHTLNLAVNDGLAAVSNLHNDVKEIVAHFKRSTLSANKLKTTQGQKGKQTVFDEVTEELSAEKSVTISKMLLLIEGIKDLLRSVAIDEANPTHRPVANMVAILKERFGSRSLQYASNSLIAEATFLVPRIKRYGFNDESSFDKTERYIKNLAGG